VTAEFPDVSDGSYLDVELNHSAKTFGSFSAFLPGEGRVWPRGRVKATRTSTGAVELTYDGAGQLDRNALADGSTTSRTFRPSAVSLRLVGRVSPIDHSASVDIWVNGKHHGIASREQEGGAEAVVDAFLSAVNRHDWSRVYDLSDRYMRNGVPRDKFTIGIGAGAANRMTDVVALGPTTYTTTRAGVRFARVPIRVTYRAEATMTTVDAELVLAVDTGGWKVLSVA
jgi:YD repeat-containing protein